MQIAPAKKKKIINRDLVRFDQAIVAGDVATVERMALTKIVPKYGLNFLYSDPTASSGHDVAVLNEMRTQLIHRLTVKHIESAFQYNNESAIKFLYEMMPKEIEPYLVNFPDLLFERLKTHPPPHIVKFYCPCNGWSTLKFVSPWVEWRIQTFIMDGYWVDGMQGKAFQESRVKYLNKKIQPVVVNGIVSLGMAEESSADIFSSLIVPMLM